MGFRISSILSGISGKAHQALPVSVLPLSDHEAGGERNGYPPEDAGLRVLTLNLAHGRSNGSHQIFQSKAAIQSNLRHVASLLRRIKADVVALQETDAPSAWSGRFSHLHYLADSAKYKYTVQGEHVSGLNLNYGTALISALPMRDAASHTFQPLLPTTSKGFVISTLNWPGREDLCLDLVSAHFDFARNSVRIKQVEELIDIVRERGNPVVVMGDFNCQGIRESSALLRLCDVLGLHIYKPGHKGLETFPKLRRRLDWILISDGFGFESYEVLPDVVSDHYAVLAEIRPQAKLSLQSA